MNLPLRSSWQQELLPAGQGWLRMPTSGDTLASLCLNREGTLIRIGNGFLRHHHELSVSESSNLLFRIPIALHGCFTILSVAESELRVWVICLFLVKGRPEQQEQSTPSALEVEGICCHKSSSYRKVFRHWTESRYSAAPFPKMTNGE